MTLTHFTLLLPGAQKHMAGCAVVLEGPALGPSQSLFVFLMPDLQLNWKGWENTENEL